MLLRHWSLVKPFKKRNELFLATIIYDIGRYHICSVAPNCSMESRDVISFHILKGHFVPRFLISILIHSRLHQESLGPKYERL